MDWTILQLQRMMSRRRRPFKLEICGCKALADLVADPAIVKRFEELGITTVKMGSAEFSQFVARQVADWAPAIKAADVKP